MLGQKIRKYTRQRQKFTLVSPMRNEGPYILEWLAWHRAIGFDNILVITNDCTDGSDLLLRHLAAKNLVLHKDHTPRKDQFALIPAFEIAQKHPSVRDADWLMILDADEFLVVHTGDNTIQALMQKNGGNCLGMAVHWKCFGDNDQALWQDIMVREAFTSCAADNDPVHANFKSIFREPNNFNSFASHAPNDYQGMWGGKNRWVDSEGKTLSGIQLLGPSPRCATRISRITHRDAQVNHYVIKSQENFLERRVKWAGFNNAGRYSSDFLAAYNKNAFEDISALNNLARFKIEYAALVNDPETLRLHHLCCANYIKIILQLKGGNPDDDGRYQMHYAKSR